MLIVWGSRMYGVKNVVHSHGTCGECGAFGRQKSYDGRKWGHLYFIPLIPSGGHVRVLKECPSCSNGQHVPRDSVSELCMDIEQILEPCLEAAAQGEHAFEHPQGGEPVDTGPFLTQAVELLYVTGRASEVPGILRLFEGEDAVYEHQVGLSAFSELQGYATPAAEAMGKAMAAHPEESYPCLMLAQASARAGQHEAQLQHLEQANASSARPRDAP